MSYALSDAEWKGLPACSHAEGCRSDEYESCHGETCARARAVSEILATWWD